MTFVDQVSHSDVNGTFSNKMKLSQDMDEEFVIRIVDTQSQLLKTSKNKNTTEVKLGTPASYICFICGEFMGTSRNDLSMCTESSEQPIFKILGKLKLVLAAKS